MENENDVMLGAGLATGMFYHAPAGTALPTHPLEVLPEAWKKAGDVTEAGITLTTDKSTTNLKNWANVIKRVILTDHSEKIKSPLMDTNAEVLKTVLGEGNVTETPATADHGKLVTAKLSSGQLPPPEAFLWLMKDGDKAAMIGCKKGQIMSMDDVTFAPSAAINWNPTITALGEGFVIVTDDGDTDANTELTSISITTPPTKTAYTVGETFDADGMVVTAAYSNGTTTEVSNYTTSPDEALVEGNTTITVSYTDGGVTKTATQTISVTA